MTSRKVDLSRYSKNSLFIGQPQRGKSKVEIQREIGQLLEIVVKDKYSQNINISSFMFWIKSAVLHDQYVLIDNIGDIEPSGYISWAWVSDKTLSEYLNSQRFILHPMSWNEGDNLIIVDFILSKRINKFSVIRQLYREARCKSHVSYKDINISIRNEKGLIINNRT